MGLFRRRPKTPPPAAAPSAPPIPTPANTAPAVTAPPTTAMPIIGGGLEAELAAELGESAAVENATAESAAVGTGPASTTAEGNGPGTDPQRGPAFAGRSLSLRFPPTVEHAADHAQTFADAVGALENRELDYTVASLPLVDQVLGSFEEIGSDLTAETILTAGFYVGEVLVRSHGYRWVSVDDHVAEMFGFRLAVQGPAGSLTNPLGKVFKRVENGAEDGIEFFVTAQLASDARSS